MQKLGSQLLVTRDKPEDFLTHFKTDNTQVVFQRETCYEEELVEARVKKARIGQMVPLWGSTLLHSDDLPEFKKFPNSYTQFRNATKNVQVRNLLPHPKHGSLPFAQELPKSEALTYLPSMEEFGYTGYKQDKRSALHFEGGEDAALRRLKHWMDSGALATYKETRNDLLGDDNSSKFSPWLA